MNLYLLRHGLAGKAVEPRGSGDSERPLTREGKLKMRRIAKGIKALGLSFDVILSSSYTRARQTAEIVADALKVRKRLVFSETLTPDGSSKDLVELLMGVDPARSEVLLVGHEPYMSEIISLLVSGERGLDVEMKKGGICKISAESLRHGRCAKLEWLLTPKQLALMG